MRLSLLAFLALAAVPLAAQGTPGSAATGGVQGRVVSKDSVPVSDVVVSIAGRLARSDAAGLFTVRGIPAGTHDVEARRIGFEPIKQRVTVPAGGIATIRVVLNEVSVRLEAMRTVAEGMLGDGNLWMLREFERRRARGVGRFYTRREVENFFSIGTAVAATTPGVREVRDQFGNWSMTFTRCGSGGLVGGVVAVFVDGMRAYGGQDALSFYRPNDIEAMEVYRSVSELPPEAVGDACAAIYIWLRRT